MCKEGHWGLSPEARAWVNNSLGGCAGLKVCHGVWRHPLKAAFIFDGEVMDRGSLEALREGSLHPPRHWRAEVTVRL